MVAPFSFGFACLSALHSVIIHQQQRQRLLQFSRGSSGHDFHLAETNSNIKVLTTLWNMAETSRWIFSALAVCGQCKHKAAANKSLPAFSSSCPAEHWKLRAICSVLDRSHRSRASSCWLVKPFHAYQPTAGFPLLYHTTTFPVWLSALFGVLSFAIICSSLWCNDRSCKCVLKNVHLSWGLV